MEKAASQSQLLMMQGSYSNPASFSSRTELKARDMDQLVKCLLCQQGDPSSDMSFVKGCVPVIPVLGLEEMRILGAYCQPVYQTEDPVSESKVKRN